MSQLEAPKNIEAPQAPLMDLDNTQHKKLENVIVQEKLINEDVPYGTLLKTIELSQDNTKINKIFFWEDGWDKYGLDVSDKNILVPAETSSQELLTSILSDGELNGEDLLAVQDLESKLLNNKEEIATETNSELASLKDGMKTSTEQMLEKGYDINNENDYNVLAAMLTMTGIVNKMPNFWDIITAIKSIWNGEEFSITRNSEGEILINDLTGINTVAWKIDKDGNISEESSWGMDSWDYGFNNNELSVDENLLKNTENTEEEDSIATTVIEPTIIEPAVAVETITETNNADIDTIIAKLILPEWITVKQENWEVSIWGADWIKVRHFTIDEYKNSELFTTDGEFSQDKIQQWVDKRVKEYNDKKQESVVDTPMDSISENYEKLKVIVKELLDIDSEIWEFDDVKIEYDADRKVIELDTPFFDWVADYDTTIDLTDIDLTSIEEAKKNIKIKIDELKAEYREKLKDASLINEVTDSISQWMENVVDTVGNFLWEHPDLKEITLEDGTELNIEFNKTENTFYIDTELFDGISDYNSKKVSLTDNEIEKILTLLKSEDSEKMELELGKIVDWKKDILEQEYNKIKEDKEIAKQDKRIKEVFAGNKKFTNVWEVTIGDDTMNVRLVRRWKNDVKIKLDTPVWDGISDKDVTIDFTKVGESFKNMSELRDSIKAKTLILEETYKNLLQEEDK